METGGSSKGRTSKWCSQGHQKDIVVILVVIIVGLYEKWYDVGPDVPYHYFTLFLLGFITFVPGSYATFNLWGAFRRWPQYDYDQVPSWDDQALT